MTTFACAIYYAVIWYFLNSFYEKGSVLGIPSEHVYFKFLDTLASELNLMMLVGSIFLVLLFFTVGLIVSHRISGPLVRLRNEFNDMNQKQELKLITFRRGDYFQEIVTPFNELVEKCKKDSSS